MFQQVVVEEAGVPNQVAYLGSSKTNGVVNPRIKVTYTSPSQSGGQTVTTNTVISGSTSESLTIKADTVKTQEIKCRISHPTAALNKADADGSTTVSGGILTGGLVTKTVNFETISEVNQTRSMLNQEINNDLPWLSSSGYISGTTNLFLSPANFQADSIGGNTAGISAVMYPSEENITVKITMAGSKGQDFNGNPGGEGGLSTFTYTLQKDTEYVFKLGYTTDPASSIGRGGAAAYFYEKGKLLVVCGGGGAAGYYSGGGGAGGGARIAGGNATGSGSAGGTGGQSVNDGELISTGAYASGTTGGKVESCTTGDYYNTQGKAPCADVGLAQWRNKDGTIQSGSGMITRGYKAASAPGYGYRFNGGNSSSLGGNGEFVGGGGSGAYGGDAATSAAGGGGGGSGYTNGDVTITSTRQGGNNSPYGYARIELP